MNFNDWKDFATVVGVIIAGATLIKVLIEYTRVNADKRALLFIQLRESYKGNENYQTIIKWLYGKDEYRTAHPIIESGDRFEFMTFFEDVAFLVNSGILNKEVAYYMFGYDAKTAWRDDTFWNEGLRNHPSWYLLSQFVEGAESYFTDLKKLDRDKGMLRVLKLKL